jgi:type VI protein secretion system component VasF
MADTKTLIEIVKKREQYEPVVDTASDLKNMATRQRRKYEEKEVHKITEEIQGLFERMEKRKDEIESRNETIWEEQALLMVNIQVESAK